MFSILEQLPQKSVIQQADAERWINGVQRWQPGRAEWLAGRLMGIGGSESGAVVRGVCDLPGSGFSTLRDVVQSKLMMRLPLRQNEHMQRGSVLEELAALACMYRYKAARDEAALAHMQNALPRKGYEWLIGNPDDVQVIGGRRFLNDYKVPSTFDDDVSFDYEAQLHHYGLLGRMAGVRFDGYLLTKLDLAPELARSLVSKFPLMSEQEKHSLAKSIANTDVPGFRVVALGVEHKKSMDADILDACGYAWNDFVLKGVVPEKKQKKTVDLAEDQVLELGRLQHQYAMAKAGMSHLSSIAEMAQVKMGVLLHSADLEVEKLPVNIVTVKANGLDKAKLIDEAKAFGATEDDLVSEKPKYVVEALVEEIKRLNGDPEAVHLFDRAPNADKAKSYLESVNEFDSKSFLLPGVSVSLSRKKADKELQEKLIESAQQSISPWFDENLFTTDFDAHGFDDDELEGWDSDMASGTDPNLLSAMTDNEDCNDNQSPMTKSAGLR